MEPGAPTQNRLPAELSAGETRDIALLARAEFATTAEAQGRRAALRVFNRRVSAWANQFTDKRLRRFAWTLGSMMDGETHSFAIMQAKLQRKHRQLHPDAYVAASTGKRRMLSREQIRRYIATLEGAGIITVERDRRQDEGGENPEAFRPNFYTVNFHLVIRDGAQCVHNFTATDQPKQSKNVARLVAGPVARDVARDVAISGSSTGSRTSSPTASSSPLRGQAHDDDRTSSGDSGKGSTAQEDHPSAGNSRDDMGGPESRAQRELDPFEELTQEVVSYFGPQAKPHLLLPRFRQVAGELEVSAEVVDQVMAWWADGHACAAGFLAGDSEDMRDPVRYLHKVLPDLVQTYMEARDAQAAELGVDAATFNLLRWLRDHQDEMADGEDDHLDVAEDREETRFERQNREAAERKARAAEAALQQQADRDRLHAAYAKERDHRDQRADHYGPCGKCPRCRSRSACWKPVHRDNIGCGHDLGEGVTIDSTHIRCGGVSTGVPFISTPAESAR
jgi:hypothetical protein